MAESTERSLVLPIFRPIAWGWSLAGGWLGRLAVAGLIAIACGFFSLTVLMAVYGIPWAYIVYAEAPYQNLLLGLLFLFLAWVVGKGWRSPARDWLRLMGKGVMLLISVAISAAAGEALIRALLIRNQEQNSLERLRQLRALGKKLPVRSTHPMAHIIQPSDDFKLVYELQPNLDMEFGHHSLRTNADGMRDDRDYAIPKPEGVFRILGIGDSGMFGWGVEQGEEYMAVLRSNLATRADGVRYEVMHIAVPGYNTHLEVESLRAKGLKYQPDIVIVGWCDNDFSLPFFMLQKENLRRRDISFLHLLMFDRPRFIGFMAGAHFRDMRDFDRELVAEDLLAGQDIEGVERAFERLRAMSDEHGFRVLVFGAMRPEAETICARVGIPWFNIREHIPINRYPAEWAVHFMHPRAEGHAVLAGYLEAELVRLGWLPPR
jgi:hypothetical protein